VHLVDEPLDVASLPRRTGAAPVDDSLPFAVGAQVAVTQVTTWPPHAGARRPPHIVKSYAFV
jgi:hypothetical protein